MKKLISIILLITATGVFANENLKNQMYLSATIQCKEYIQDYINLSGFTNQAQIDDISKQGFRFCIGKIEANSGLLEEKDMPFYEEVKQLKQEKERKEKRMKKLEEKKSKEANIFNDEDSLESKEAKYKREFNEKWGLNK